MLSDVHVMVYILYNTFRPNIGYKTKYINYLEWGIDAINQQYCFRLSFKAYRTFQTVIFKLIVFFSV